MSEDPKVKVEGFERIKLKTREEKETLDSTETSNLQATKEDSTTQPIIEDLAKRFSPQIGGESNVSNQSTPEDSVGSAQPQSNTEGSLVQPPLNPTQDAGSGIAFDFNFAMRVSVPKPAEGEGWRIQLYDLDTEVALLDQPCFDVGHAATAKHHFLNGRITVSKILKNGKIEDVFTHQYNAENKDVLIVFPVGSLGDSLGWMPYAEKFRKKHRCNLTLAIALPLIELFEKSYPEIKFVDAIEYAKKEPKDPYYASYYIGLFFKDEDNHWQPEDFRQVGLHRTAGYILGVDPTEEPPKLTYSDDTRPIEEPYVVIASQASTQCKYWNNPFGWYHVIKFLKSVGYRVICIDKEAVFGRDLVWNYIPNGAEDQTGNRSLAERARWLKHAEFFVGLSSGLAWLAWGAGIPVVIISGFTHPSTEFDTPYRVFSTHVCNSCWNDVRYQFDHSNYLYCPKHQNTPRQFECTKGISHQHVIKTILQIPGCRSEVINNA
ncbi:ADP-heptose:LPS heptosyltransferase (RfaF) (PDB:1PSW) [Commensalibacter communis]|uniref:ADP-heptose:LPS heptosyltransferase (RfaF) n=1 Tax=Commensalibacter communis TaxID=2972786 RepID=A0A9W4TQC1_9PROT|nr:autotransporter strand-loop-strand O-heptosyltransferase [Commensalibacter communis]CAI3954317.1 ADP-heptose:LPS heptosyltransferase (RfaF) (PDB:1PSW) [Commensalibacter communis]CAI3955823.1 ADP-heptose:LPS heptosyltransferase (RfaF) (PDB:1PSW) [Commensalibacter communis]CAI3956194.1 ADP-heptose:LPS heptosyltransferase (RfaF) (PDB:1PSW) [Commensalibacter communis]CAI3957468.1 ADP-heptose:LPS heptosyltransferase (RfaF) (PDB:1PSW) [Commensalibacter communis]CAI3957772.1 ADP-heptose:LPS heptos